MQNNFSLPLKHSWPFIRSIVFTTHSGPNPNPRKVKPKPDAPNKCDPMLTFDAVTELRGETIIFKDRCDYRWTARLLNLNKINLSILPLASGLCRFYWRLHPQMPEPEQTLIKSTWPTIPNKVDAAYENPEKDQVMIFSGGSRCAFGGFFCLFFCVDGVQDPTSVLHLARDPDVGFERIQPGGRLPQVHPQTGVPQNSAEGGRCRAHWGYGEDSLLFG